jgi:hypothetical protein
MRHLPTLLALLALSCSNGATPTDSRCDDGALNPITGECEIAVDAGTTTDDTETSTTDDADSTTEDGGDEPTVDMASEPDSGPEPEMGPPPDPEVCDNGRDDNGDGDVDCLDEECAPTPDCGMCAFVASPDPVREAPLPGEPNPGQFETVSGEFTDDYLYNAAGTSKIGTRREWGGTIVFYGQDDGSQGMNDTNVIDANDTGREVQVAFYDVDRAAQNCAWDASCATTDSDCENSITYLGWNPVQGGNRCNVGSGVENVDHTDGTLTVETVPLHWNPNWDRQDCVSDACDDASLRMRRTEVRVHQRLRFVRENVVELDYVVVNEGALDHARTAHELPTVYTANGQVGPDLWRLFDSQGQEIAIDEPANDGFMRKAFDSPGGWVTMQNQNLDYGVGHYTENRLTNWSGWQLRSLPFNNFRPTFFFALPANATVRARSYLILGSKTSVEAEANWLDTNLAPFGVIDSPTKDMEVTTATMEVRGWALDNKNVTSVTASIDGGAPTPLTYGQSRPDVCLVWPSYPGCDGGDVGYGGTVDVSSLSKCAHLLEVHATDSDGNTRVIARRRFVVL